MNCHSSNRTRRDRCVPHDPQHDEHALEDEESCGADEAGNALAELAECVGVVVHAEAAPLPGCGEILAALHREAAPLLTRLR